MLRRFVHWLDSESFGAMVFFLASSAVAMYLIFVCLAVML